MSVILMKNMPVINTTKLKKNETEYH